MVDRVINLLKWPAALFSVALLPSTLWASVLVLRRAAPAAIAPAAGGAAVCGVVLWLLSRVPLRGVWLATLEHELTHALFAVATGHRVIGLRTTWRRGGMIAITGAPGNWLITLAPYFFPTTCVAAGMVWLLLPPSARHLGSVLLGAALAYHIWSTAFETHWQQPDLRQAGRLFSLLPLPTANLWAVFAVVACAHGGWQGGAKFCRQALDVGQVCRRTGSSSVSRLQRLRLSYDNLSRPSIRKGKARPYSDLSIRQAPTIRLKAMRLRGSPIGLTCGAPSELSKFFPRCRTRGDAKSVIEARALKMQPGDTGRRPAQHCYWWHESSAGL